MQVYGSTVTPKKADPVSPHGDTGHDVVFFDISPRLKTSNFSRASWWLAKALAK
jgi:hypothetical protein